MAVAQMRARVAIPDPHVTVQLVHGPVTHRWRCCVDGECVGDEVVVVVPVRDPVPLALNVDVGDGEADSVVESVIVAVTDTVTDPVMEMEVEVVTDGLRVAVPLPVSDTDADRVADAVNVTVVDKEGDGEAVSDGVSLSVAEPLLVSVLVADVECVADADGDEHITLPADEY